MQRDITQNFRTFIIMQNKRPTRRNISPDRILNFTNIDPEPHGLMEFINLAMPDAKRNDVKKWMRYGHIMVDGSVKTAFDAVVAPGANVDVNLSRPFPVFKHPRIELVYEDDDVIVINKGYGLLSVTAPGNKKEDNAFEIMKAYVKNVDPSNKLYVVHRLDRDTSGLMMFAKSEEAQQVLRHNWNNMVLERLYVAVLEGYLDQDKGYVKSNLAENSQMTVYSTDEPGEGKLAVTHYEVLKRGKGYTLAQFSLDTGRKNQIRVHAHDLGHPIAGDRKYGASSSPIHRLCLHARTLRFAHPITRKDMNFETPIPANFAKIVK